MSAEFDAETQLESASHIAERPSPQPQIAEIPEEELAENNPGLIDGISQGGHHSFEPAPAASFLPEQTHVEAERECESAAVNGETEMTSGILVSAVCRLINVCICTKAYCRCFPCAVELALAAQIMLPTCLCNRECCYWHIFMSSKLAVSCSLHVCHPAT